jgi:hypothetical protein
MSAREQLLQELTQVSDEVVEEVLSFLLLTKSRRANSGSGVSESDEDDQPKEQVLASLLRSLQNAKAERTHPVKNEFAPLELTEAEAEKRYGYGSMAEQLIVSDDFDQPLEELADYM